MTRVVIWAPKARHDFIEQLRFIAADNVTGAELVETRLHKAITILAEMPAGRPVRVSGTYEKYVLKTSLIIAYRLMGHSELQILRIIHTSRNWLDDEWPSE